MPNDPDPQEQARQIVRLLEGALSTSAGISPGVVRSTMERAFERFGINGEAITPEEALRVVPSICKALETFAPPERVGRLRQLKKELDALLKRGSVPATGGGGSDGGEPGSAAAAVYADITPKPPRRPPPGWN
jgi:hypothetical protein